MAFDFGRCPCGGGSYKAGLVTVRMTIQGRLIEITDVPRGSCGTCGGYVYKAETLRRIEGVMRSESWDSVVLDSR